MSDKDEDDIEKRRFSWDGPEKFSDICNNCVHSRAAHLAIGAIRPVAGRSCRGHIYARDPSGIALETACPCDNWENN